jgi:PPOX class probable F420-dependent enzyme
MDRAEALERLASARVGHFASITPDARPHLVAVTFVVVGLNVVHMIDEKPKATQRLQRLRNVETTPIAALLVDHFEEDWASLWWIRVDGEVTVEKDGDNWWEARARLKGKYKQYRNSPPSGPAIFLSIDRLSYWEGS